MRDALRLSRGMTYKNALAGLPFGGGKSVILAPADGVPSPALFQAMGTAVDRLGGRYVVAEDVGTSVADMREVGRRTRHVSGLPPEQGGLGDPSPHTARGVFVGLRAGWRRVSGGDLAGARVAVQGLGHVGWHLCRLLADAGARLVVADLRGDRVSAAVESFGARAMSTDSRASYSMIVS